MRKTAKITAICNQKGGVGKTVTAVNLGIGLAREGKKVLLVDMDAQGSLTASLGYQRPDQMENTLATILGRIILDEPVSPGEGILHQAEAVDLLPANIELSGLEVTLVNTMSRETILREYLNSVRDQYDVILLDCCPSLGMLTINALAAADQVLIPMQAHYLSIKGLEQLIRTISNVKRKINPGLEIAGILITMADLRTTYSREIIELLRNSYGDKLRIFNSIIPQSIRAAETSAEGRSIYLHDPAGKVSAAYASLTREVLAS
jgi:chromosome partitioning protein